MKQTSVFCYIKLTALFGLWTMFYSDRSWHQRDSLAFIVQGLVWARTLEEFVFYASKCDWRRFAILFTSHNACRRGIWLRSNGRNVPERFLFFFRLGSQIMTDRDFRRTVIIKQLKKPNGLSLPFHGGKWLKKYLHSLTKYAASNEVEWKTLSRARSSGSRRSSVASHA